MTWEQVYAFADIIILYRKQAKFFLKRLFVKNGSLTPNAGESWGIETVIKSDLDQIFIMLEKNGS